MGNKLIYFCISSVLIYCTSVVKQNDSRETETEKIINYWDAFPQNDDFDKIVIELDVNAQLPYHTTPQLFHKKHPPIADYKITDPERIDRLSRSLTGVRGIAGAIPSNRERNFAEKVGRIIFYKGELQYEITVSNDAFFMGPVMSDFHLFYSWDLAKLINDIALEAGPGLTQRGFISLCGARSIAINQWYHICEFDWEDEGIDRYEWRPAEIWNILPSKEEWLKLKGTPKPKE